MPDYEDGHLHRRIAFTLRLDELKDEHRRNPLSIGDRREGVAEHCWHLAMATIVWASESPTPINVPLAVMLATVHDFPELITGDHSVYSENERLRPGRELAAMTRFTDSWSGSPATEIFAAWSTFESGESPEAVFVQALDVILPILHNHSNLTNSSWVKDGIAAAKVRDRIEKVRTVLPWLATQAEERVEEALVAGALK